jgi:hypothetical protein
VALSILSRPFVTIRDYIRRSNVGEKGPEQFSVILNQHLKRVIAGLVTANSIVEAQCHNNPGDRDKPGYDGWRDGSTWPESALNLVLEPQILPEFFNNSVSRRFLSRSGEMDVSMDAS